MPSKRTASDIEKVQLQDGHSATSSGDFIERIRCSILHILLLSESSSVIILDALDQMTLVYAGESYSSRESGIQDNYQLLRNEDDIVYGIQIEDAVFSWNDVFASDNPLPTQTVIDKPNRRAAVIFGNQSTVIPSGYTATIDPDYSMTSDAYDNYWDFHEDPTDTDVDNADNNKIQLDATYGYASFFAVPVTIMPYSIVTAATLTVYVVSESGGDSVAITRVDSANMPAIDDNVNGNGGSPPTIDASPVAYLAITGTSWKTSGDIGKLVQETINEGAWASGNRMGFRLMPVATCAHTIEDYQSATSNHAKVSITYVAPSENWLAGYGYRQAHSVDGSTGAGEDYQVKITVEYGSGTSADGTIYCNEHCDTDFDDIRFTDNDGETELDYWMEEKTDSDDATFWVEVTDDLGSDQTIYCYYGKSGDSTTSDGEDTFLFFDDFEDGTFDTDKWDVIYGTVNDANEGSGVIVLVGEAIGSDVEYGYNTRVRGYSKMYDLTDYKGAYCGYREHDDWDERAYWDGYAATENFRYVTKVDNVGDYSDSGISYDASYHIFSTMRTANRVLFRIDDDTNTEVADTTHIPTTDMSVFLGGRNTNPDLAGSTEVEWVFLGKYVTTEPAHYTWANEQEEPNNVPVNSATPVCTNMDDTDNLYAGYKTYLFTSNVTDADGYADIEFVSLYSYDTGTSTQRWMVQYQEADNSWAEVDADGNIELVTGSCAYSKSGDSIDITFAIKIEWKSAYYTFLDDDLRQYVKDDPADSDNDEYDSNYNYIARVSMTGETLNDGSGTVDRGTYDTVGDITASGTLVYFNSVSCRPPTDEIDVWVTCPDTPDPDWHATNYEDSGGTFSVAVDSDNVVGLDTYTFKVVTQDSGSGGADYTYETNEDTYIADKTVIQTTVSSDAQDRLDVDGNVEIRVTASLAYTTGGTVWLGAGDTITLDGVSMSWDAGNSWFELSRSQASVGKWNYYVNSSSETGHGITKLDLNDKNVDVIWDRTDVVVAVNMTWTVIGYYINVSYTGTYEYDSTPWSGYATVANTSLTTGGAVHYEELTFSTVVNKTFYATAIEDAGGYGLTVLGSTNTVWCVFDDIVPSGAVAHSWVQYSATQVYLIWGIGSNWMWDYNDTLLEVSIVFHGYSNTSSPEASGSTYGSGAFGGLTFGAYTPDWHYVDIGVNCEVSINGIDYDWQIWNAVLEVEILHTIYIENFEIEPTDYYFWIAFQSNWNNASITMWDALLNAGTDSTAAIYWSDSEGMHQFARSTTVGTHNITILLNGSATAQNEQNKDYSVDDSWWWYSFTYIVVPDVLAITNPVYTATDDQNFLSGEINVGCDWYAYNNDTEMDTGTLGVGSFAIEWDKNTTTGYYVWGVKFDDGTTTRWVNGTFEVPVIVLDVDIEDWSVEDVVLEIVGISNLDINWYIYNEGVYSTETGSETGDLGFHFTFAKNTAIGKHNFSIYFNDTIDGSQYRWFNRSYTISAIYGISNIYTYNQGGDYIDYEQFTFLVNGTLIHSNEFYNRTDHVFLITVQDVFGSELYSATHSWSRTIKITIDVYTFIVANMLDDQFIYFNMTRLGGGTWSKHIVPTGFIEFELLYAATYNYEYSTIATDSTVRTATGSVTVSEDTAIIIFEFGLVKILSEIRLISPGGGGVGKEYVEKQFASVNATLSMMWTFLWGIGLFLVVMLWIVPYVGKRRRRGEPMIPKPRPKPRAPGSEMIIPSASKLARKERKQMGIPEREEAEYGPRQ